VSNSVQNATALIALALEARSSGNDANCDAFLDQLYKQGNIRALTGLCGALTVMIILILEELDQDPHLYIEQIGLQMALGEFDEDK